ncbi:MAG: energy transducer TonB [Alphaproteobacteria bacterium]|nr:energy transducer TonB [Alphaproteobacteria bacterium]
MREGAILSGLLHGVVILLLLVGLPELFRRELEPPPVIPIEIVNIADITQAPDLKVKPKIDGPETEKEEKPEPPKPTPVVEKTPEPEPEPEKTPEPEPVPEPEAMPEVTMDDLLAPIEEEKKKEEKKKEEKKKEEKKKEEKPKPKEKKKKKQKPKKDFMKLLNNIDKMEASADGPAQKDQDENSTSDHAANNINAVLSITELDLIRRQLAACWNVPAGAQDAKDLYVDVRIEMNPDATVQSAVVTGSSGNGSSKRAAEDSALRAVRNPKCSPLKLPLHRYDQWKTITIRFDPKHIL